MSRYIALETDGDVQVHAASAIAGYRTLCGMDGGLTSDEQKEVDLPKGQKLINCPVCFQLFEEAKRFRPDDFSIKLRMGPRF
jgi:hypothetical protein